MGCYQLSHIKKKHLFSEANLTLGMFKAVGNTLEEVGNSLNFYKSDNTGQCIKILCV